MSVSLPRLPLTLGFCANNLIPSESGHSTSSSSSGIPPSYRYPEANRCSQIAFEAREWFSIASREGPIASKKITSWTICSLTTALSVGVAAALSRTSAYRRLLIPVAVIGAIFFFVVCLPKLLGARKELNDLEDVESQFYRRVETLINDVITRIGHVNMIFPEGAIVNGQLTDNFEINQDLQDGLDRWIDTLRLVHGWDDFAHYLQFQILQQSVNLAERGNLSRTAQGRNLRHFNEDVTVLGTHLPDIIQSIEQCRQSIETILSPDSIWPGDTLNTSTENVKRELCRLVALIGLQNEAIAGSTARNS